MIAFAVIHRIETVVKKKKKKEECSNTPQKHPKTMKISIFENGFPSWESTNYCGSDTLNGDGLCEDGQDQFKFVKEKVQ